MKFESMADRKIWMKAMRHIQKKDRTLAKITREVGYIKVPLHDNYFESLVRAMIYQQISGAAGDSIIKKFYGLYGGKAPTPEQFLKTPEKRVRGAGISPQKYSYMKDLSQKIRDGHVELGKFYEMQDEDIITELDEVRGIGRWTAEMFVMFSLGRVDVWPVDDLGIKRAVMEIYKLKKIPEREKMLEMGNKWRPYRSVAALYLWHRHDNKKD